VRQTVFRLLLQDFGRMIGSMAKRLDDRATSLGRLTAETWLCRQGLRSSTSNAVRIIALFGWATLPLLQTVQATDVEAYYVRKGLEYDQSGSTGPTLNANNGYGFDSAVFMYPSNTVRAVSLMSPFQTLPEDFVLTSGETKWVLHHKYKTQAKLESLYPSSDPLHPFAITINAVHDGLKQVNLQLVGNAPPDAPFINNFPETQMANPNGYFQVRWNRVWDADNIQLRIEDDLGNQVFQTPYSWKEGALDGHAMRALIGPGWLAGGKSYRARLMFAKDYATDRTSYPGAEGDSGYYSRTTFYITPANTPAPDVDTYEVAKGRRWIQTNSAPPVPEIGLEYEFEAAIQPNQSNAVSNAVLLLPPTTNAAAQNLAPQPGGMNLGFTDFKTTQSILDSFYGSTNYTLAFDTAHDGHKSLTLPLPPTDFPPAPHVMNFDSLRLVQAAQPFIVFWYPWLGGTVEDYLEVRIEDQHNNRVFRTPHLGKKTTLHGLSTSVVVPAGTLLPGGSYQVTITFARFASLSTTDYSAVLGLSDFYSQTRFDIQTAPAEVARPLLKPAYTTSNNQFQFTANVAAGVTYRVDGSDNLLQWVPLSTNAASSSTVLFAAPATSSRYFYRLVLP
jgi:hypothetical protein